MIYIKKLFTLKNIYYENEKAKYYIINEDNIEKRPKYNYSILLITRWIFFK